MDAHTTGSQGGIGKKENDKKIHFHPILFKAPSFYFIPIHPFLYPPTSLPLPPCTSPFPIPIHPFSPFHFPYLATFPITPYFPFSYIIHPLPYPPPFPYLVNFPYQPILSLFLYHLPLSQSSSNPPPPTHQPSPVNPSCPCSCIPYIFTHVLLP